MTYMLNIERGKIIQEARKAMGLSVQQLADRIGVSRVALLYWERGRDLTANSLAKLAHGLGIDMSLLQAGVEDAENYVAKSHKSVIIKKFPLLESHQINDWLNNPVISNYKDIHMPVFPINNIIYGENSFSYEIIGKSMINNDNAAESLFPGEIVIVDPDVIPKDGKFVLVKFGDNDIRIRQYREDGAYRFLHAFDPEIKSTPLDQGANVEIVGTLLTAYKNL